MAIVAKLSGNSLAKSLDAILNQYEGIYVGLGMKLVQGSQTPQNPMNSTSGDSIQQEIQNEPGLGTLINILKQRKKNNTRFMDTKNRRQYISAPASLPRT